MTNVEEFLQKHSSTSLEHHEVLDRPFYENVIGEYLEHFGVKGMKWGVRKDVVGVTDLQRGGIGDRGIVKTFGAVDGDSPYKDPDHQTVANTTWNTRAHLTNMTSGPFSPTGAVTKVNASYTRESLKDLATRTKYDEEVRAVLQKEINKVLPKGAAGSIFTNPDKGTMVIYVGTPRAVKEVNARLKHSADLEQVEFKIVRDADGFIVSLEPLETEVSHEEIVANFLEHHGIKGMKWGVRRSDAELGRIAKLRNKLSRKKSEDEGSSKSSGGSAKDKKDDDDDDSTKPRSGSSDHASMMASLSKDVEGMSTRELQELNNRAQAMQNYQRLFGSESSGKSPLERQVQNLQLQKQKRDLEAELTPERRSAVQKLIKGADKGFSAYQKLDKAVGGDLSKALSRKLGLEPPPTATEQARMRTELAKANKAEADARAAMAKSARDVQTNDLLRVEEFALKGDILRGDLPSRAVGYTGGGKRRASGSFSTKGSFEKPPKFIPDVDANHKARTQHSQLDALRRKMQAEGKNPSMLDLLDILDKQR